MRRTWLVVFALVFALASIAHAQESPLTRYELDVALDPDARTLAGTMRVDVVNDAADPIEAMTFLLLGNLGREPNPYVAPALQDGTYPDGFDPAWTEVSSVTAADGASLPFAYETMPPELQTFSLGRSLLRVSLPAPLAPGERFELALAFETKFPHASAIDNVYYRDVFTWRFGWYPVVMPADAINAGRFALPNADYGARITVPEGYVLASGADRVALAAEGDGTQTYELAYTAAARSFPLAISPDFEVVSLAHGSGVTIESFYLPGHQAEARLAASFAASLLTYYEERFGPYGYERLAIVDNPSPGTYGMAADGMVLLGTDNYRLKDVVAPGVMDRFLEWLLAHELAHLWWGIGVGADFNAENWLSEGFAQYLSLTYFEDRYGASEPNVFEGLGDGVLQNLVGSEFGYFNLRRHNVELPYLIGLHNRFDEAIVKQADEVDYANNTFTRIYNKGYLVLRALEGTIGREALFEALNAVYERFRHRVASVAAFQQAVEAASGRELDAFFADWLHGAVRFDPAVTGVESSETDDGYETSVSLRKDGGGALPVEVAAETESGQRQVQRWEAGQAEGTLAFVTDSPVKSVHLDPRELLPDADRANNHWPRKLVWSWDEAVMPLDAYYVRFNGLGLQGGFRTDHAWSVSVVPRVEIEERAEDEREAAMRLLLDGTAAFNASLGRSLGASGSLAVSGYEPAAARPNPGIDGEIGLNWTGFAHPETGAPGTYWYSRHQARLSVGALGEASDPLPYASLILNRTEAPRMLLNNRLSVRAGLGGFVGAQWTGTQRARLAPSLYLDLTLSLGAGLGALPEAFQLDLSELESFEASGQRKAAGGVELVLPPLRNLDFSVVNLALLDALRFSAFARGGQVWSDGGAWAFDDPKVEVGGRATGTLTTLLGLVLDVSLGYAYPVLGAEEGAGGSLFFSVSSPLL